VVNYRSKPSSNTAASWHRGAGGYQRSWKGFWTAAGEAYAFDASPSDYPATTPQKPLAERSGWQPSPLDMSTGDFDGEAANSLLSKYRSKNALGGSSYHSQGYQQLSLMLFATLFCVSKSGRDWHDWAITILRFAV
jgi:hypothetical protein